ncbi:MAG: hypothetical protein R2710_16190 [Acidimicrobiales bacterium]
MPGDGDPGPTPGMRRRSLGPDGVDPALAPSSDGRHLRARSPAAGRWPLDRSADVGVGHLVPASLVAVGSASSSERLPLRCVDRSRSSLRSARRSFAVIPASRRVTEAWSERHPDTTAATVVVAANGYPADPVKGVPIPDVIDLDQVDGARVVPRRHDRPHRRRPSRVVRRPSRPRRSASVPTSTKPCERPTPWSTTSPATPSSLLGPTSVGVMPPATGRVTAMTTDRAYAAAGVSFSAGDEAIEQIAEAVKETHTERVVAGVGSFGGVFDMANLGMDQPLLVSSTDTCGTKTVLAAELSMWDNIGADIVRPRSVNDVLVQPGPPLGMARHDLGGSDRRRGFVAGRVGSRWRRRVVASCGRATAEVDRLDRGRRCRRRRHHGRCHRSRRGPADQRHRRR